MRYNPSFVEHRQILTEEEKQYLHDLSARYSLEKFKKDNSNYEEVVVDFVYTSAKIEGNTYNRSDTAALITRGITAGGKTYTDAVMLLNLREAFEDVINMDPQTPLDLDYLCDLHKVITKNILLPFEQGIVRTVPVDITYSDYKPPIDVARLRTEINFILPEANKYTDPFERAIYLHCNLAYLQYFRDGNKRTARLMQTAALVQSDILPLFFNESLVEIYRSATVNYYETGQYEDYVAFFKENYELVISNLTGEYLLELNEEESVTFNKRLDYLQNAKNLVGPMYTLATLAKESIGIYKDPLTVNWANVERETIIQSIGIHGHSPSDVSKVICKYSPGAYSVEKQQGIIDDIARIAPGLLKEYEKAQEKSSDYDA